jgi:hypothetical protein
MTRIFKAVKPVHSDTIDRHFKIKRRILLAVFASILISLFPPSQAFYLLQAFTPSPNIATISSCFFKACTSLSLCSGDTRA